LWNVATGTLARELSGLTSPVNVLVFDPKGLFLASATEAGEIVLWNVTTGIRIISIPVPIAF
jgi:WD40 repeat protein